MAAVNRKKKFTKRNNGSEREFREGVKEVRNDLRRGSYRSYSEYTTDDLIRTPSNEALLELNERIEQNGLTEGQLMLFAKMIVNRFSGGGNLAGVIAACYKVTSNKADTLADDYGLNMLSVFRYAASETVESVIGSIESAEGRDESGRSTNFEIVSMCKKALALFVAIGYYSVPHTTIDFITIRGLASWVLTFTIAESYIKPISNMTQIACARMVMTNIMYSLGCLDNIGTDTCIAFCVPAKMMVGGTTEKPVYSNPDTTMHRRVYVSYLNMIMMQNDDAYKRGVEILKSVFGPSGPYATVLEYYAAMTSAAVEVIDPASAGVATISELMNWSVTKYAMEQEILPAGGPISNWSLI